MSHSRRANGFVHCGIPTGPFSQVVLSGNAGPQVLPVPEMPVMVLPARRPVVMLPVMVRPA